MDFGRDTTLTEAIQYAKKVNCKVVLTDGGDRIAFHAPTEVKMEPPAMFAPTRKNAPIGHLVKWLKRLSGLLFNAAMAESASTPPIAPPKPGSFSRVLAKSLKVEGGGTFMPAPRLGQSVEDAWIEGTARLIANKKPADRPPERWTNKSLAALRTKVAGQRRGNP